MVIGLASIGFAQSISKIDEAEYWKAIYKADETIEKIERRKVEKISYMENGVEIRLKVNLFEHLPPNKFRQVLKETEFGKTTTIEFISINNSMYCKTGTKWTRPTYWCGKSFLRSSVSDAVNEFTVETPDVKSNGVKIYRRYSEFGPEGRRSYDEEKIWIDEMGRITKEQGRSGDLDSDYSIIVVSITYEYLPKDPKIKIEAPIK